MILSKPLIAVATASLTVAGALSATATAGVLPTASSVASTPTDGLWQMSVTQTGPNALYGAEGASVVSVVGGAVAKLNVSQGPSGAWELLAQSQGSTTYSGVAPTFGTLCGLITGVAPEPIYSCSAVAAELQLTVISPELMTGTATVMGAELQGTFPLTFERVSSLRATPASPMGFVQGAWKKRGKTYRTNLSWSPPADTGAGGEVTGYEVAVLREGETLFELTVERPAVILRKLPRGQVYVVRVQAVNAAGAGDPAGYVVTVPGAIPPDGGGDYDPGEYVGPRPKITAITPNRGGIGSFVRISGNNLDNLRYIRVGSRLAGFYVNSVGDLVVTVPPGSGTVDVQVMTLGGQDTMKKSFTYTGRSALRVRIHATLHYGGS